MEPVYVDIHIHTSENPDSLVENYDVETLFEKVRNQAQGQHSLLSLTDHNTINKNAYLAALDRCRNDIHLILGVELHIHYVPETEAYHCHIFFKSPITEQVIDEINKILDKLYPAKVIEKQDKSIPTLDEVINNFDDYDFILLPHGGQSHATFNNAIPAQKKFDTMMERSIYYNQFDGFTARSNSGREETDRYFKKLGISAFVNLITCSDNYNPSRYPAAKASNASPFLPTWMFSEPTFDGFRMSLSENSRLVYSHEKPLVESEHIEAIRYRNEHVDIDVHFSSGLNVIIGGSSSGKTLLVDSIWRKLTKQSFEKSSYQKFGVEHIEIVNPSAMHPHYLEQNYIMQVVRTNGDDADPEHGIETIDIIRSLFPDNTEISTRVTASLSRLKRDIFELLRTVKDIENLENKLHAIPQIGRLLVLNPVRENIITSFLPQENVRNSIRYEKSSKDYHINTLQEIKDILRRNPFVPNYDTTINELINQLKTIYKFSNAEVGVYQSIKTTYDDYANLLLNENKQDQTKAQQIQDMLEAVISYIQLNKKFQNCLNRIASYRDEFDTQEIKSSGHSLFVKNQYKIDQSIVLEVFNSLLKANCQISRFIDITPYKLYDRNFSKQKPKVHDYEDFSNKVYHAFEKKNKTTYHIRTEDGQEFQNLSAGWKTSILLDLILGYDQDMAPIIIDQPEDNLATKYINDGLVKAIKKVKNTKQIILVSHNATIPMMGDAQQIIYCENKNGIIAIRSAPLEGEINGKPVLDLIASITDGGKSSIKKRVKKYNLKKFTE